MKLNFKKGSTRIATSKDVAGGFTLIELLVVVAIIGILAAIVLAALSDGREKGGNAGIKNNLNSARTQAEVFYNTNTAEVFSYNGVCTNGTVGGVQGIGALIIGAAKARGFSVADYDIDAAGDADNAVCNDNSDAWVAQVPLIGGGFWCVDSNNESAQFGNTVVSANNDYSCDDS